MSRDVVLVTGGGRGFGEAIARRFASEGAAVAVLSRNRAQLDAVVAAIEADGGQAFAVTADVTSPADVDRAVSEVEAALGPITLFINNAACPARSAPCGRSMWTNGGGRSRCISARRCCSSTASCPA
jgi:NAD(P)-dependent dehydrogenase (short-subunit alcohol dehydrogenase family)